MLSIINCEVWKNMTNLNSTNKSSNLNFLVQKVMILKAEMPMQMWIFPWCVVIDCTKPYKPPNSREMYMIDWKSSMITASTFNKKSIPSFLKILGRTWESQQKNSLHHSYL